MTKIVCISDTHTKEDLVKIPECDILIHSGDCDIRSLEDLEKLNDWFGKQPAKFKIFVAGNHDFFLEKLNYHNACDILNNCYYLYNNWIIINGLKIWGSPYTPRFKDWAFMADSMWLSDFIWKKIPADTDIVITHGPPWGIMDLTGIGNHHVGCPGLLKQIKKIQPKLHIFGHIHECYGEYTDYKTDFINASQMTDTYKLENQPIIWEMKNE